MRDAAETCRRLVDLLNKYTDVQWTFGYLGNISGMPGTPAFRDDRQWYAFAAHPGRVGTHRDHIGGFSDPTDLVPLLQGAVSLAIVLKTSR